MRYDKTITLKYTDTYNDFSEPETTTDKALKCAVLQERKLNKKDENKRRNQYDLKIAIQHRAYLPYVDVFENEDISITYDGRSYEPVVITRVNTVGGKPRHYVIDLKQVT